MNKGNKQKTGIIIHKNPRRGEIWLVIDRNEKHNGKEFEREFENSVQGGTRTCVIVSNNTGNMQSPNVEIVYTTTKKKSELPTHFFTESTPKPSTVQCEAVMTVSKNNLVKYYGTLTREEMSRLDKCLKISLGIK